MKNKEITLEDLALKIEKGFEDAEKKTDEKFDKFALMIAKGFNGVDKRFEGVDKRFEKLEEKMDRGFKEVNTRIDDLKNEVEHRRVHVFDHKDLEHRVEVLERKAKFAGAR